MPKLRSLFRIFDPPVGDAASLYLQRTPKAKNWPAPVTLPLEIARQLLAQVPALVFPSLFRVPRDQISLDPAQVTVEEMEADREVVVWIDASLGASETELEQVRIEFCFARLLLARMRQESNWDDMDVGPILALADLLRQIGDNADDFVTRIDEFGSRWLLLRDAMPYRQGAFFTEATVLVQCMSNLIKVVIGETEDDIDTWYRYEWLAPFARKYLEERLMPRRFWK